jgi:hypothetical protein
LQSPRFGSLKKTESLNVATANPNILFKFPNAIILVQNDKIALSLKHQYYLSMDRLIVVLE